MENIFSCFFWILNNEIFYFETKWRRGKGEKNWLIKWLISSENTRVAVHLWYEYSFTGKVRDYKIFPPNLYSVEKNFKFPQPGGISTILADNFAGNKKVDEKERATFRRKEFPSVMADCKLCSREILIGNANTTWECIKISCVREKKNVFPEFFNDEKLVFKIFPSIFPARGVELFYKARIPFFLPLTK